MLGVGMGVFLATLDGSIVNIAMPVMENELHTNFTMIQWVIVAYLLVVTTLMLGMGRLGDMLGKKPVYMAGFVIFTLGSALCGTAPSVEVLIAYRAIQAIGAAMVMALGAAIITEAFPPHERGQALGIVGTLVSAGVVSGPVLGGLILSHLSWHWIFFVNVPVGILGTFIVLKFIPFIHPPAGQTFDFPGAISLFISLVSFLLALTLGQKSGFADKGVLALLALWFVFSAVFIYFEIKMKQPMLDLRLFLDGHLSVNIITGFTTFVSLAGLVILIPFFLENILEYSPRLAGLHMAVVPVAMGIVAPLSGRLSDKWGTRPLTVLGLGMLSLGYLSASTIDANTTSFGYIIRFLPIGIGMGFFQSPNNSAIMGSVPRNRLGIASGLLSITRTMGQTVGVSAMSTLWAGFVLLHSGSDFHGTPTTAPAAAQIDGLRHTLIIISGILAGAFVLGFWAVKKGGEAPHAEG